MFENLDEYEWPMPRDGADALVYGIAFAAGAAVTAVVGLVVVLVFT